MGSSKAPLDPEEEDEDQMLKRGDSIDSQSSINSVLKQFQQAPRQSTIHYLSNPFKPVSKKSSMNLVLPEVQGEI